MVMPSKRRLIERLSIPESLRNRRRLDDNAVRFEPRTIQPALGRNDAYTGSRLIHTALYSKRDMECIMVGESPVWRGFQIST